MDIIDCSGSLQTGIPFPVEEYHADGQALQTDGLLPCSQDVNVLVNGKPRLTLSCVPDHIVDAVMGRLFLEGDISHVLGALMANIGAAGRTVYVQMSRAVLPQDGWPAIAEKLKTALGADGDVGRSSLEPKPWNPDHLIVLADGFEKQLGGAARLRGIHSCALAAADDIMYLRSDLDSEAALDKVVGAAFVDGVDISECTLVTNAPLGVGMFARMLHASIGTVLSLACPTEQAVALARLCRITLADAPEPGCIRVLHDATA